MKWAILTPLQTAPPISLLSIPPSEIMEVTIVTEDTDGSKNVTEYFVIETPR